METVLVVGGAIGLVLGIAGVVGDWQERRGNSGQQPRKNFENITPVGRMLQARATRESQVLQEITPQNSTRRAA